MKIIGDGYKVCPGQKGRNRFIKIIATKMTERDLKWFCRKNNIQQKNVLIIRSEGKEGSPFREIKKLKIRETDPVKAASLLVSQGFNVSASSDNCIIGSKE
jgi:hypothetical protein